MNDLYWTPLIGPYDTRGEEKKCWQNTPKNIQLLTDFQLNRY